MNPKQFLLIGGIVLLVVGILGFVGVIGPTPEQSVFGETWWFDSGENWAHLVLGVVALILSFGVKENIQKPVVLILGIVGVLVGIYSAVISTTFLGANLENPADTILHLAVGIWALVAALMGRKEMPSTLSGGMTQ